MSANNYLLIEKQDKWHVITHRDFDTDKIIETAGKAKTLENAVRRAKKYESKVLDEGGYIEYGLDVKI